MSFAAGGILPGLGTGALRPTAWTNAPVDIYVSPTKGNDAEGIGTQASPIATLEKAEFLIPNLNHDVVVHLDANTFVLPDRGTFIRSRFLNGLLTFKSDEAWDSSVFTVLKAGVAQAGTTPSVVKLAGMAIDAFLGKTLEVTSGGVRQRALIRNNTATDLVPVSAFNAANPGDSVRILEPKTALQQPTLAAPQLGYGLIQDCPCRQFADAENFLGNQPVTGVTFEGLKLLDSDSFGTFTVGSVQLFTYGVEARVTSRQQGAGTVVTALSTSWFSGSSLPNRREDEGWGFASVSPGSTITNLEFNSRFIGHAVSAGGILASSGNSLGGNAILFGGRCAQVAFSRLAATIFGDVFASIPFLIDARGSGNPAVILTGPDTNLAAFGAVEIHGDTAGVQLSAGAIFQVGDQCTGDTVAGLVLSATSTSRVLCFGGAPALGAGSNSWQVLGAAAFDPAVALAAAGNAVLGTDGTVATHV